MYTPAEILEIAKVSQYLASQDKARSQVVIGRFLDPSLPKQLRVETVAVEWAYNQYIRYGSNSGVTAVELESAARYLLGLCGPYALKAERIISGSTGSGGVVVIPGSDDDELDPIYFVVGGSFTYAPSNGDTSYINPDLDGITDFYVISNADGGTLWKDIHFTVRPSGGFDWLLGRTFFTGDAYTIIFY